MIRINGLEKIEQGQRGIISIEEENFVTKKIPKIYLDKEKIKNLLNQDIPNVVRYKEFRESPDGSGDLIMEKLENPHFSIDEKEVIKFFFCEIQKNITIENFKIAYKELNYESCISSLKNHFEDKIKEFKDTDFQKDFVVYLKLLNDQKVNSVLQDVLLGFKNLLKKGIFFNDQKAEHVMYSTKERSYKLIDVV